MLNAPRRRTQRSRGFTLTELAVSFTIVALLIGGAMMTLSAQVDLRNRDETQRRLQAAVDSITAFAIVNHRLPCPARYTSAASHSQGLESFCASATSNGCSGSETTTVQTHGNCSNFYDGYVPATSIGLVPVDGNGFALDAWGNRMRYVIARDIGGTGCGTATPTRIWSSSSNLKTYGLSCTPATTDLNVCASSTNTTANNCGALPANAANYVASSGTVVMIVYSVGKNGSVTTSYGADENENVDGDSVFVTRTASDTSAAAGAYDDQMIVVPVGLLYSKLIDAGVLP